MNDPKVRLKNPVLAGILAVLLPGLGHAYQGRYFKAACYSVCILGLFFTGMAMAGWQAVQTPTKEAIDRRQWGSVLKYAAQLPVGLPVMAGWIQRQRLYQESNHSQSELAAPMSADFQGTVHLIMTRQEPRDVRGELKLTPAEGNFGSKSITGELVVTTDGKQETFHLTSDVHLDQPIQGSKLRTVYGHIADDAGHPVGDFRGQIPRPLLDWIAVPMDENQEQDLHRQLGKFHELAMVFTWVAGLLNVLAIWDAIDGPAIGYDLHSLRPSKLPVFPT